MLEITERIERVEKLERCLDGPHRLLKADGKSFCGDFTCHGECGLPKLIRLAPEPESFCGYIIEQATALLGIESVWSTRRWRQSQPWRGQVALVEYDEKDDAMLWR